MRVLGIVASPTLGGRTDAAVAALLAGCAAAATDTTPVAVERMSLADVPVDAVLAAMQTADAVVFGSPTYRAAYSGLLKDLLERTERGRYATETSAPLAGKTAALVMTANAQEHFLALDALRNLLAGFFGVQVLSPGLFLGPQSFNDVGALANGATAVAVSHGNALVDLTAAVRASQALQALKPQV